MTATYQIARDLGWEYFEKLAKQRVMQVQSAADPPKKIALGERAVHGRRRRLSCVILHKEEGQPVEIVYPAEGTPIDHQPERDLQGRAQSERGAAVPDLAAFARRASNSWSTTRRQYSRACPGQVESPGGGRSRTSR